MKKSRFTETEIVAILKQADAGLPVKEICRQAGISVPTYYQWNSKYGGMEASDLKRVRELEAENARLKPRSTSGCRQSRFRERRSNPIFALEANTSSGWSLRRSRTGLTVSIVRPIESP